MGGNLIHAHTIVRDTFAREVRAATDERNRLVDVLTRLRPDQLSASDLELLAADEKGFADLFEAKLAAGEWGMTTALSIAYLHAYARYAREMAESAEKLNKVLDALRECESNRTYLSDKELLFAKGEEYVALFERRALDQAGVA